METQTTTTSTCCQSDCCGDETATLAVVEVPKAIQKVASSSCCSPSCCRDEASAAVAPPFDEVVKEMVRAKYAEIAALPHQSCCGGSAKVLEEMTIMAPSYAGQEGYVAEADLGLGCGLPTEFAGIEKGDTVLDLGAGAGNDVFIARQAVGESGFVIGVDMTQEMVDLANKNKAKLGFENVSFRLGEIENLPIRSNSVDVVVSNCVMNLVPNKARAFAETFRVLKPKAHFSISDIVLEGEIPEEARRIAELYAGCVSGALQKTDYLQIVTAAGFQNLRIQKERAITLPESVLTRYLAPETYADLKARNVQIKSITLYAEKPALEPEAWRLEAVDKTETEVVHGLLASQKLPSADLDAKTTLWALKQNGALLGVAGLEQYGKLALLRSVAIAPAWQKTGLGTHLIAQIEARAKAQNIAHLVLLTTTAEGFFAKLGYQNVARTALPEAIRQTSEFNGTCPASAVSMEKFLG